MLTPLFMPLFLHGLLHLLRRAKRSIAICLELSVCLSAIERIKVSSSYHGRNSRFPFGANGTDLRRCIRLTSVAHTYIITVTKGAYFISDQKQQRVSHRFSKKLFSL